jgi:hypothetical protein
MIPALRPEWVSLKVLVVYAVPPMAAIYGLGRGTWLRFEARRRLAAIDAIHALPTATLVSP